VTSKARVLNSRASWGAWASLNSRSVLATGSDIDDAIRLWDPTTGEMLAHNTGEGQRPVGPTGWGKWGRVKGRLVLAAAGIPWGATKYFNGSSILRRAPSVSSLTIGECAGCSGTALGAGSSPGF
jgi:hypothetical protein